MSNHTFGAFMPSFEQTQQHASDEKQPPTSNPPSSLPEEGNPTLDPAASSWRSPPYQSLAYHRHRTSTSTSSTTTSPTSTGSLLGPQSSIDTPGTSPDTPASSSYPGPFHHNTRTGPDAKSDSRFGSISNPPRKLKNPKNLALNNLSCSSTRPLASEPPMSADGRAGFEPPAIFSPSFVNPAPPRKKSTTLGLTIQTPSSATFLPEQTAQKVSEIPPTPSLMKPAISRPAALRQFQSTPSLPLLTSNLPRGHDIGSAVPQFTSNLTDFPVDETDEFRREPEGKKEGSDAYPDGPVCIYDPHVYLYFEPTAEEASAYDVIFNVASEVKNPFLLQETARFKVTDLQTAVDALSLDRSFSATPTDNKRSVSSDAKFPEMGRTTEYIHIPWEHNSAIVPGTNDIPPLHDIIRIIDDRVSSGKRVLIHCQCGVSRSASLIVAYGLFKNTNTSVQEAYDMVKQKSKWIGPNMSLIMQLQEYRNDLLKPSAAAKGHQKANSKVLHGRKDTSDPYASESSVPQTAPLPQGSSPARNTPPPIHTEDLAEVSAGPSSAPSDYHWPSNTGADTAEANHVDGIKDQPHKKHIPTMVPIYPENPIVDPAGQLVQEPLTAKRENVKVQGKSLAIKTEVDPSPPKRQATPSRLHLPGSFPLDSPLASPRSAEFAMTSLRPLDDGPSFGITSPRDSTFASSPGGVSPVRQPAIQHMPLAPIPPPDDDPMLGLSSPRATSFGTQISNYFNEAPRAVPLQPPAASEATNAAARADLRSQLGFSNNMSAVNLSEPPQARSPPPALETRRSTSSPIVIAPPSKDDDFPDELMSPRATEFTSNPFSLTPPMAQGQSESAEQNEDSGSGDTTPTARDPRSPPSKGSSPIVRNIWDILDS